MIGITQGPQLTESASKTAAPAAMRNVLTMVPSDRMAGSIPVWAPPRTEKDSVAGVLSEADAPRGGGVEGAMAYAAQHPGASANDQEFGFHDLLDMVNPLQHIPIINQIYRHITGDKIKPVAQVVGDAVYGGFAGGAMSLANVIVTHETGKDIPGNVMSLLHGQKPVYHSVPDKPEERLDTAANGKTNTADLPGTTLALADMGGRYRYDMTDDRAAARMVRSGKAESLAAVAPAAGNAAPVSRSAFHSLHLND